MTPMRASDQDRQEAVLALADAYAEGRLDADEFEVRQSRALVATYLHDLDPLFADLPSRVAPASRPAPAPPMPARRGPRGAGAPFLAAFAVAAVAAVVLSGGHALLLVLPFLAFGFLASRRRRWAMQYAGERRPPWADGQHWHHRS